MRVSWLKRNSLSFGKCQAMSNLNYKCARCNRTVKTSFVEYEEIQTCLGTEDAEVCPDCGNNMLIFQMHKETSLR